MVENDIRFGPFQEEITRVAESFNLDRDNLEVEFFNPGQQGIFVEKVGNRRFRIHLSLEEGRIVSVKQIEGPGEEASTPIDHFAKYKPFMK